MAVQGRPTTLQRTRAFSRVLEVESLLLARDATEARSSQRAGVGRQLLFFERFLRRTSARMLRLACRTNDVASAAAASSLSAEHAHLVVVEESLETDTNSVQSLEKPPRVSSFHRELVDKLLLRGEANHILQQLVALVVEDG